MIKIIADTLSCIPPEEAKRLGIAYLPQIVIFGEDLYRDDTEINSLTFLEKIKKSSFLPKTAAPQPILYNPIFQEIQNKKDTALVICPSSKMSGTFRSAEVAAQDFPDADIHIVDTQILAAGLGSVVLSALDWVRQGLDIVTIKSKILDMSSRNRVYFVVDTLEFLHRGGRIGAASALFGSMLDMKPILTVKDGLTEAVEKQRTKRKAVERMKALVAIDCPHDESANIVVMHGDALNEAEQLVSELKQMFGVLKIDILYPPPAVLVHSGPGVLAVSYFHK